jgi:hypothetical protein
MPIAEMSVPIFLNGKSHTMRFNANTMVAYEEATGKFFMDSVASLYDVMRPMMDAAAAQRISKDPDELKKLKIDVLPILRKVPMRDLRALIWAALHEYDENDVAHWPLTIEQVGRALGPQDIIRVFSAFLRGNSANSPTKEEAGESQARSEAVPESGSGTAPKTEAADGGGPGIELPADAFV